MNAIILVKKMTLISVGTLCNAGLDNLFELQFLAFLWKIVYL